MDFNKKKVQELIDEEIIFPPMDGNHGEKHPKTSDYVDDGIPFILVPDLVDGLVDLEHCNHISKAQADTLSKGISITGDVLFTHKATIGKVAIVDTRDNEYIILTPQVTYYRVKNPDVLDNRYLYYYFKSNYFQYIFKLYASSGGTRDYLGIVAQRKLPIILPDISVQKYIVSILVPYDDLIANNNKRIKILEQMAENLYKEWFVRFRFPGYETAEFVDGVPNGWYRVPLKQLGEIVTGKTPSMEVEDNFGDEILFVKTPDMHGNMFVSNTGEKLSNKGHMTQPKKMIPELSIMVSCIGTGGIVSINTKKCHTNQQINSIILKYNFYLEWAYFTCCELREIIEMFGATGTTMTNLSKGKFEKLKILMPKDEVICSFHEVADPIFENILRLQELNQNLTKQRDLLLPRLMSGKLQVK